MEVERKIRKIGNSLGVHIPSKIIKQMELEEGDAVYVSYKEDKIIITRSTDEVTDELKNKVIQILDEYLEKK
ncbi:AbrB/MazE/SpoVT family DNA-binding domain-containing protein [Fictibacillus phosphorivorans]|uniref:AbrB/MazE/SpoVT family DNA-binding domain-containing protein n=1 Tax=Fictibacillus phosphorivorans TaxID=1221500 RepID=UPI001292E6D4|nr:AbrB/MazE/SpoVT family DNA-binding domain-containing protein [Fictibacillus phosphorivorans]MQR94626.1 AbrB/MazE/SpoVT family DNA-binding domain-containing protein [Fictibacillus phosphorivorans]